MKKRGFTLIETLVAIAILSLAVVGPLYTADRAIVVAQISNQQLTASYLAQEGVEYVRAMRDHEYLSYYGQSGVNATLSSWNDFLAGTGGGSVASCRGVVCKYDPAYSMQSGSALTPCAGGVCPVLYLANGVYTERTDLGGSPTLFRRSVEVMPTTGTAGTDLNGNPTDVVVTSTVSWPFHGTTYSVSATEHLTPWQ